ncbi:DUF922 domain-containing protein [Chryseobacterium lactis]|uniref:DUF922 domain-containing protein n=1 Tax=Chryseobacterium lactis TaxID=1241981 RepID=A0A3G6RG29_CHRLC|nr:DUF922 domain-containing protein [Chryseobacterium lactis]AZA83350.1 DUF922 domain-containing protein [Chryseobacterium lactis]AZB03735.1 DUF922 domain-containing protein [Chryseobacterium lactis]PNW11689.1 DUF922 domain-containing protein [Chryseobacterium lactis]
MKLIVVFCLLALQMVSGQKIIWKENQKLIWDNFKSPVNRKNNADVAAYTHCGWEYSIVKSTNPKSPVTFEIKTFFSEDKSWKDVKKINDYILLHEQKHFDIAELFVRKFRKAVSEKIKNSGDYDRLFKTINNGIHNEYKNYQMSYDRDTQHGMNKEKQAEYNAAISEELEHLKSYKAP